MELESFRDRHNAQPTVRTVHRPAQVERDIQTRLSPKVLARRPLDERFYRANPTRWNTDTLSWLNNNKVRYNARMLNPVNANAYAHSHGYEFLDNEDIDGDGKVDIAVRNRNGELVWYNGYTRTPSATIHIK